MGPLVIYIYDCSNGYQSLLEKQLDKAGVDRLADEIPAFTWGNRIKRTVQIAEAYPDRTLFFVDAWDTLFLGNLKELEDPCWADGITFATEKKCWPDPLEAEYNVWWEMKPTSRWRYLNSNPMAGKGSSIARAIRWGWERFPLAGHTNDVVDPEGNVCERFYTKLLLQAPKEWGIRLDTGCELAQTTTGNAAGELAVCDYRIKNLVLGTFPIFLHINGWDLSRDKPLPFDASVFNAR